MYVIQGPCCKESVFLACCNCIINKKDGIAISKKHVSDKIQFCRDIKLEANEANLGHSDLDFIRNILFSSNYPILFY